MELGQLVDYVIEWNNIHEEEDEGSGSGQKRANKRKATQADWDAFLG